MTNDIHALRDTRAKCATTKASNAEPVGRVESVQTDHGTYRVEPGRGPSGPASITASGQIGKALYLALPGCRDHCAPEDELAKSQWLENFIAPACMLAAAFDDMLLAVRSMKRIAKGERFSIPNTCSEASREAMHGHWGGVPSAAACTLAEAALVAANRAHQEELADPENAALLAGAQRQRPWHLAVADLKAGSNVAIGSHEITGGRIVSISAARQERYNRMTFRHEMYDCYEVSVARIDYEFDKNRRQGNPGYLKIGEEEHEIRSYDYSPEKSGWRAPRVMELMSDSDAERLKERGRWFVEVSGDGPSHCHYAGTIIGPKDVGGFQQMVSVDATGDCMVDVTGFLRQAGHGRSMSMTDYFNTETDIEESNVFLPRQVRDEDLFMLPSSLWAFSFRAKMWGRVRVEGLRRATYDREALGKVVFRHPAMKGLLQSVVRQSGLHATDIVRAKGRGTIVLLRGQTGTGKTLTAEGIAHTLGRPLYSLSAGELGTTPAAAEKALRMILQLGEEWDAVILLDEAEVFIRKRTEGDFNGNAMTAVMLRETEYFSGVLIMTCNDVTTIDPAIRSRVTVEIEYPEFGTAERAKVWRHILGGNGFDADSLCAVLGRYGVFEHPSNGRQIRNAVANAMKLAADEGLPGAGEQHLLAGAVLSGAIPGGATRDPGELLEAHAPGWLGGRVSLVQAESARREAAAAEAVAAARA